jgi:hypothetical protein
MKSSSFYLDRIVFIDRCMKSGPNGPFNSLSEKTYPTGKAQIIGYVAIVHGMELF